MTIKQAAIDLIVALKGYTMPRQAEYAYNQLCKTISEQEEHCLWIALTNEEQQELYDRWVMTGDGWGLFYLLIDAKLQEKNL